MPYITMMFLAQFCCYLS